MAQSVEDDGLTSVELAYKLYPRISGLIILISSLCMISMAWKRRKAMFHRLVLVMSIHQIIYGLAYIIGNWAIPRELDEYEGNFGNWGTCTTQGFAIYIGVRVAMIYYGCFSVYSYFGILAGFDKKKYQWIEKWIHLFVHFYPFVMGAYFLATKGLNPAFGYCRMASYPLGCETDEDVICERGPDSFGWSEVMWFWLLPMVVMVIFPTAIMAVLYFKVKRSEDDKGSESPFLIKSKDIVRQSGVYLSSMYWTLMPFFIVGLLQYFMKASEESLVPYVLVAQINFSLFGLWSMLAYWHFAIEPKTKKKHDSKTKEAAGPGTRRSSKTKEFIFNTSFSAGDRSPSEPSVAGTTSKTMGVTNHERVQRKYSFNIFDGTNASGHFAEFVHDGDSEDEFADNQETKLWAAVQEQI
jgi:hypothetical protein